MDDRPSIERRVDQLAAALRDAAEPGRAEQEKRYLKSELDHYGTRVPEIRRVATSVDVADRDELIALATALWGPPIHEHRMLAVMLLIRHEPMLHPDDIAFVETLLRQSRTWALVDELAARCAGPLLERHPDADAVLERWSADDDVWIRRSVLLAHLIALRAGGGDWDRFCHYADAMLDEHEFWIRKAIGWVLRDTGKRRPELVADWVRPRADRLSGVTRREVVKVVPDL